MSKELEESINFIKLLANSSFGEKHFLNLGNHEVLLELSKTKKVLLKAQKENKALEIIKEKNVDVLAIKESKTLEEYNRNAWEVEHYGKYKGYRLQLTQEEFDLLKEVLE